jgi:hypothetical protein
MTMKPMEKYGIFRAEYDEVNNTLATLVTRATFYISIESLLIGALSFKWDEILKYKAYHWSQYLYCATIFSLLLALILTIWAMWLFDYLDAFSFKDMIKEHEKEHEWLKLSNQKDFLEERIVEMVKASVHNDEKNDFRARLLSWAGSFLTVGIVALLLFLIVTFRTVDPSALESKQSPITLMTSSDPSAKPVTVNLVLPSTHTR